MHSKNVQILNFIKIHPSYSHIFPADKRRDRQTVMTELTFTVLNCLMCLWNSCMNVYGQCCVLTVTYVLV